MLQKDDCQKKGGQLGQGVADPDAELSHEWGQNHDEQVYQDEPPQGGDKGRNASIADGGEIRGDQDIKSIQNERRGEQTEAGPGQVNDVFVSGRKQGGDES